MTHDPAALDELAAELYGLAPQDFTAARNARAAKAGGDLARSVKALRKPTVAAWAVNLLVRDGQLGEAVELSRALHEAQDDLDAAELTALGRQRRQLVAALTRRAADLADAAGTALSAAARDDVSSTVNAAIVDAAVAAAVLTGRLVRPVDAAADPAALAEAVGGSLPGVAAPAAPSRDDLAERRARKAAEAAAREADRAASEAGRTLARAEARLTKARERVDHLAERIDDVRTELARLEDDARGAADAQREREAEHRAAAAAAKDAARSAERARAALESG
jgi:hypothetical protein